MKTAMIAATLTLAIAVAAYADPLPQYYWQIHPEALSPGDAARLAPIPLPELTADQVCAMFIINGVRDRSSFPYCVRDEQQAKDMLTVEWPTLQPGDQFVCASTYDGMDGRLFYKILSVCVGSALTYEQRVAPMYSSGSYHLN